MRKSAEMSCKQKATFVTNSCMPKSKTSVFWDLNENVLQCFCTARARAELPVACSAHSSEQVKHNRAVTDVAPVSPGFLLSFMNNR